MSTRTEATLEDLHQIPGKAELVSGRIIHMSPTGGLPGYAAGQVFASLRDYARRTRAGYALGDNVGFVARLPQIRTFSPDAAFHTGELTMRFVEGAPVFAVEVRSDGDYGPAAEREMAQKRSEYFAAGTQVVWDVDWLSADVVSVYRSDNPTRAAIYRRGELAEAEPAVPGWTMSIDDLFPAT